MLEDGKSLVVGVTEKDQWRELKKAAVTIAPDQLVALEFSAVGDVLSVSLDGKPVVEEIHDTTYRSGSPGLAVTKGVTLFKDIQVKVLRGEEEIATSSPSRRRSRERVLGLRRSRASQGLSGAKTTVSRPAKIPRRPKLVRRTGGASGYGPGYRLEPERGSNRDGSWGRIGPLVGPRRTPAEGFARA